MKQRPILFNGAMVRAILNGQKTQTRRVCKNPIYSNGFGFVNGTGDLLCHNDYLPPSAMLMDVKRGNISYTTSDHEGWTAECPFGDVGDRLWVREAWMPDAPRDGTWADVEFYGCKDAPLSWIPEHYRKPEHCLFSATWTGTPLVGWTPSIHMPRWASRITLEITSIRVERLQDISEKDAAAEGFAKLSKDDGTTWKYGIPDSDGLPGTDDSGWPWSDWEQDSRNAFKKLWHSIGGDWEANPWVWVIEFKRVEQ